MTAFASAAGGRRRGTARSCRRTTPPPRRPRTRRSGPRSAARGRRPCPRPCDPRACSADGSPATRCTRRRAAAGTEPRTTRRGALAGHRCQAHRGSTAPSWTGPPTARDPSCSGRCPVSGTGILIFDRTDATAIAANAAVPSPTTAVRFLMLSSVSPAIMANHGSRDHSRAGCRYCRDARGIMKRHRHHRCAGGGRGRDRCRAADDGSGRSRQRRRERHADQVCRPQQPDTPQTRRCSYVYLTPNPAGDTVEPIVNITQPAAVTWANGALQTRRWPSPQRGRPGRRSRNSDQGAT